jgi:hypothetical protein
MEGIKNISTSTIPNSIDVLNGPVDISRAPSSKRQGLPWTILGIAMLMTVVSGGLLVWKIIFGSVYPFPDLIVTAPDGVFSSVRVIPTLAEGVNAVTSEELVFEDQPYRSEQEKFQISIPLGWQIDDSGSTGSVLVLSNPQTTIVGDKAILTYVYISVAKASGGTLNDYIFQAKDGLQTAYKGYLIEEDQELIRQGMTYYLLGGSYLAEGIKMKNRNVFLVYNNRGYAISAVAPESVWSKTELLLNATIFSFKNF